MEHFVVKLTTHFIDKFYHQITISQDLIDLELFIGEFYGRIDFKALHYILETETMNFANELDVNNFNKTYLLTVTPELKLIRVRWFKVLN